jgi:hypothetical protein
LDKEQIFKLRKRLRLNQSEFGDVFGVHPMIPLLGFVFRLSNRRIKIAGAS